MITEAQTASRSGLPLWSGKFQDLVTYHSLSCLACCFTMSAATAVWSPFALFSLGGGGIVGSSLNGESLRRREALRGLRRMRAVPPGMAGQNAQRLRTFQAALEQAEQFLSSAESAGYETKPVFAFYALSQAGRAIAAASGHLTDDEYRPSGHGMRVLNTRDQTCLWAAEVEVNKAGTPQSVARAMGSPM
ncbi:YaaC family protein [Streptomyces sp. NBC_01451]|uniref:YaaC family protein n=1 Tax=Streptomyces sp. NBC_01451 TaxID=2903872 RepID=UPI003FCD81D6